MRGRGWDEGKFAERRYITAVLEDLAVLRIDAPVSRLKAIPLGTSKDLQVGQRVFAIGNPFGLDQSLTTGVISALGREIESVTRRPIQGVIQTDAAINPGNSGGPLLDSAGRLIGVNTAIYSPSGGSAGIGFAIPADSVNRIVPELIRYGKIIRPGLGIQIAEEQIAERLGGPAYWSSMSSPVARPAKPASVRCGAKLRAASAWAMLLPPSTAGRRNRRTNYFSPSRNTVSATP